MKTGLCSHCGRTCANMVEEKKRCKAFFERLDNFAHVHRIIGALPKQESTIVDSVLEANWRDADKGSPTKLSSGKVMFELFPLEVMEEVSKAMMFGIAKGYDEGSYKKVPVEKYFAAFIRHYKKSKVEAIDPTSNLPHMAHMAACACFMLDIYIDKGGERG